MPNLAKYKQFFDVPLVKQSRELKGLVVHQVFARNLVKTLPELLKSLGGQIHDITPEHREVSRRILSLQPTRHVRQGGP